MIAPIEYRNSPEQIEHEFYSDIEIRSVKFWVTGIYKDYYDPSNDIGRFKTMKSASDL